MFPDLKSGNIAQIRIEFSKLGHYPIRVVGYFDCGEDFNRCSARFANFS
jgi:hypothetical protein